MDEFEGMAFYDPGEDDIINAKMLFSLEYPAYDIIESSIQYLTYISGESSKFHAFWLATDKDGNYYAWNAYARIGYNPRVHRIIGPTSQESAMSALRRKLRKKENQGYTNRTKEFLSAETFDAETFNADYKAANASQLVDLADGLGGTIEITSLEDFEMNYLTNYNRHYVSDDEVDFIFLDGSMATCIQDPVNVLSTFVEGYSPDSETFDAHDRSRVCPECKDYGYWDDNPVCPMCRMKKNAETYDAQYGGPALLGITGDTALSSFTGDELAKSSAIHGDFDTASLDYSGKQNIDVRDVFTPLLNAEDDEEFDWDRYTYKHTDLEVTHPLKTGFLLGMGWLLAPVVAGVAAAGVIGLLWKGEE